MRWNKNSDAVAIPSFLQARSPIDAGNVPDDYGDPEKPFTDLAFDNPPMTEVHSQAIANVIAVLESKEADLVEAVARRTDELAGVRKTLEAYRAAHKIITEGS